MINEYLHTKDGSISFLLLETRLYKIDKFDSKLINKGLKR